MTAPLQTDHRRWRSTARYQRMRWSILAREPLCRVCRAKGFTEAATQIDHITPVSRDPSRFWDVENLQPICRVCHEEKTARENSKPRGVSKEGFPL